jgi:hypothetical protein
MTMKDELKAIFMHRFSGDPQPPWYGSTPMASVVLKKQKEKKTNELILMNINKYVKNVMSNRHLKYWNAQYYSSRNDKSFVYIYKQ